MQGRTARLFQHKAVALKLQKPLAAHAAQLCAHGTAVYRKVIGQLLAVKRNGKTSPARLFGLSAACHGEKPEVFPLFCVLTPFQGAKGHYAEGKRTAALAAIQKPAPVGTVSETPLEAILETLSRRVSPSSSQDWFPR